MTISVKMTDQEELYDPFDPSGLALSPEFLAYLEQQLADQLPGELVEVELVTREKLDLERLQQAFGNYLDHLQRQYGREARRLQANSARLTALGIGFILLGFALEVQAGTLAATMTSTIGSFSIWEAAGIWIKELPSIKLKQRRLKGLRKARFTSTERKE